MLMLFAIALGGALGALARYYLMSWIGHTLHPTFPWGTLAVNSGGSFLMGLVLGTDSLVGGDPRIAALVTVGLLGGFTTFSTFALDVAFLAGRHRGRGAAIYAGASLILAIGGLAAGLALARVL